MLAVLIESTVIVSAILFTTFSRKYLQNMGIVEIRIPQSLLRQYSVHKYLAKYDKILTTTQQNRERPTKLKVLTLFHTGYGVACRAAPQCNAMHKTRYRTAPQRNAAHPVLYFPLLSQSVLPVQFTFLFPPFPFPVWSTNPLVDHRRGGHRTV